MPSVWARPTDLAQSIVAGVVEQVVRHSHGDAGQLARCRRSLRHRKLRDLASGEPPASAAAAPRMTARRMGPPALRAGRAPACTGALRARVRRARSRRGAHAPAAVVEHLRPPRRGAAGARSGRRAARRRGDEPAARPRKRIERCRRPRLLADADRRARVHARQHGRGAPRIASAAHAAAGPHPQHRRPCGETPRRPRASDLAHHSPGAPHPLHGLPPARGRRSRTDRGPYRRTWEDGFAATLHVPHGRQATRVGLVMRGADLRQPDQIVVRVR
jgi:hypothetical protein